MKSAPYGILRHKFIGGNDREGYTYELTFNKSMEHTGKHKGICEGLDRYDRMENSWWRRKWRIFKMLIGV